MYMYFPSAARLGRARPELQAKSGPSLAQASACVATNNPYF
jgi:hypothetical protein